VVELPTWAMASSAETSTTPPAPEPAEALATCVTWLRTTTAPVVVTFALPMRAVALPEIRAVGSRSTPAARPPAPPDWVTRASRVAGAVPAGWPTDTRSSPASTVAPSPTSARRVSRMTASPVITVTLMPIEPLPPRRSTLARWAEVATTSTPPASAVTTAPESRRAAVDPARVAVAYTPTPAPPMPRANETARVWAWTRPSVVAVTVTEPAVEVTEESATNASTVLPMLLSVSTTAPDTAARPTATEIDGSTATMPAESEAASATVPAAVTTAPSSTNARVRLVVVFVAEAPDEAMLARPPEADTAIVNALIVAREIRSGPLREVRVRT